MLKHLLFSYSWLLGIGVSASAQAPTTTVPTSIVVTDGDASTRAVRVLVASKPPFVIRSPHGWRLDHDGPANGDGRVLLELDRRRQHFAWAVTPDRRRASSLVSVPLGSEVVLSLQAQDLQRIDFEIDPAWFEGEDAPTQVFAFDPRMPGISFPMPLPAAASSSIELPPLPMATQKTKVGKRWICDWILALADRKGQWCVAKTGVALLVDEDRIARQRILGPQLSTHTFAAGVDNPYFELRPYALDQLGLRVPLGICRVATADSAGAYRLRVGAPPGIPARYDFHAWAPGHELVAGTMNRLGNGDVLPLTPVVRDIWQLRGAMALEGVVIAHCAIGSGLDPEPCLLPISKAGTVDVPTAALGDHRYDLFWWRNNDCVPLVLNAVGTGSRQTIDIDQAQVSSFRVSTTTALPDGMWLANETGFTRWDGRGLGMLWLALSPDGIAMATLLPGKYYAIAGGAMTRFQVGAEPVGAPIEVRHTALAEFTSPFKGRVAGHYVAEGYPITIEAKPIGELTPEQQVEVQMGRCSAYLPRPGEFELALPRSISAWRVTAEASVPMGKNQSVPHRASGDLPTKAGAPLLLRLARVPPADRK